MKQIYNVTVDGQSCPLTVSDENEALQAAYAAGGAILGIWREKPEQEMDPNHAKSGEKEMLLENPVSQDFSGFDHCLYLITDESDITPELFERTVRRHLDLPWRIAETDRLWIREFSSADPLEPESEQDGFGVFSDWEKREAYRRSQYRFAECGLWALVEKKSGIIIGKAGITEGELGYHVYSAYQKQGYAAEAGRAILRYAAEELGLLEVTLQIEKTNQASICLAEKLGFHRKREKEGKIHFAKSLNERERLHERLAE